MKRKGFLKRNLAFLLTAVMAMGIVSYVPDNASEVRAEGTTTKTLGTSGIANPGEPTEKGWSGSYVYFGKYNGDAVKYRVLDNETTVFSKEENESKAKTMLLDCDSVLWTGDGQNDSSDSRFDKDGIANVGTEKANEWAYSDIKTCLNGSTFLENTDNFSKVEQAAIAASTKQNKYAGDPDNNDNGKDGNGEDGFCWEPLNGEKIFLLDAKEATNSSYGYSNDNSRIKTGGNASWWLRSPSANYDDRAGHVYSDGYILNNYVYLGYVGVSPALNIDLSSVLFSSEISANSGEYKLTLIDETGLKIALNGNVNKSVDSTNGDTLKIPYALSGDGITSSTVVSVFITNGKYEAKDPNKAEVVAYGTLQGDSRKEDNTGEGKFELTTAVSNNLSNYHVYIVAENINGEKETDYASVPIEIVFAADEPNTNTTDDSNSNDTSTSTETATTETTEAAPITITYTVRKDDYMRKIAREHGITLEQLIALNPQVKNPNLIYAGQVLVISTTGSNALTTEAIATKTYTVQRGDSLYKIARKNGLTLAELKSLNENLFAQKYIFAGQQVLLK